MQRRILYLGIDPTRYPKDGIKLIHHPLIQTVPIKNLPEIVKENWSKVSHILSTSPRSAVHFLSLLKPEGKKVLAIGSATAEKWREEGIYPSVAKDATQEGMIELLKTFETPFVLYPKSTLARQNLADYLRENRVQHLVFDLYETVFLRPKMLIDLNFIDEIVFTSPSTVEAFFLSYFSLPKKIKLKAIGPITRNALKKKVASNFFS